MTTCRIVGLQRVNFVTQDGTNIDGVSVYYTREKEGVTGVAAGKVFVSGRRFSSAPVKVGEDVIILFNQYGKVEGFLAPPPADGR